MKVTRFILGSCACGCGISIPITAQCKLRRFARGHQCNGQKYSEEHRRRLAASKFAENNPQWKGDRVKNDGLHWWVRSRLPEPEKCETCKTVAPYDLANITGVYSRDLTNWKYLCRKCHMISDGRLERLHTK
jgi:hypothetical protein